MPIQLDSELANKLNSGMRSGDAIELPFPVVYSWVLNGQASYKSQGGALYYGGWACKADDLETVSEQSGITKPVGWQQVTISSRDGDEYEAYAARHVIVAPIGKRESWLVDGHRSSAYVEGGRRHLQVLAYLASVASNQAQGDNGGKSYIPWGPVVLSAKGYQARNLLDAFAKWEKATAQLRRKVAPGVPAWCFYLALGTFGKERQTANVGKAGAQSPITPVSAFIPEGMDEKRLESLFVGDGVAAVMADLMDQAAEWLVAWKTGRDAGEPPPPDNFDAGIAVPDNLLDEIPF
jgi:hypothetical protein